MLNPEHLDNSSKWGNVFFFLQNIQNNLLTLDSRDSRFLDVWPKVKETTRPVDHEWDKEGRGKGSKEKGAQD